jgi:hypothetical protein
MGLMGEMLQEGIAALMHTPTALPTGIQTDEK